MSVGSLVRLLQFQGGAAHLVEITLAEDSPAERHGHRRPRLPPRRGGRGRGPGRPPDRAPGRHDAAVGDEVLVLVTAEAEDAVHALFIPD